MHDTILYQAKRWVMEQFKKLLDAVKQKMKVSPSELPHE